MTVPIGKAACDGIGTVLRSGNAELELFIKMRDVVLDELQQQVVFVFEVVKKGAFCDAGFFNDAIKSELTDTVLHDDVLRGLENLCFFCGALSQRLGGTSPFFFGCI